jgi:hypothetical protein
MRVAFLSMHSLGRVVTLTVHCPCRTISCNHLLPVQHAVPSQAGDEYSPSAGQEISNKVKGKVMPVHAMKAHRGSRSTLALILNFGNTQRCVVNITLQPLYPLFIIEGASP